MCPLHLVRFTHRTASTLSFISFSHKIGSQDGTRTRMPKRQILSLLCMPIPPPGRRLNSFG